MRRLGVAAVSLIVVALSMSLATATGAWSLFKQESRTPSSTRPPATISPPTTTRTQQGINGTVTIGPIVPVCRVDGDPVSPAPGNVSIQVVLRTVAGDQILAPVNWTLHDECELEGSFYSNLNPGTYSLDLTSCIAETTRYFGCAQLPITVQVRPGEVAQVQLSIDTGIR